MKLNDFLRDAMIEARMTQVELSKKSGVPQTTISGLLNRDNKNVNIDNLLAICKALNCNIEDYIKTLDGTETYCMPAGFSRKYSKLDAHGKRAVNKILDIELDRCNYELAQAKAKIRQLAMDTSTDNDLIVNSKIDPR